MTSARQNLRFLYSSITFRKTFCKLFAGIFRSSCLVSSRQPYFSSSQDLVYRESINRCTTGRVEMVEDEKRATVSVTCDLGIESPGTSTAQR